MPCTAPATGPELDRRCWALHLLLPSQQQQQLMVLLVLLLVLLLQSLPGCHLHHHCLL
jgi:hypothetical protein